MPAMRVFVLSDSSMRLHTACVAAGDRLPILPDRNRDTGSVPLWKVMVGPAPTNSNRTRKGPVFFVAHALRGSDSASEFERKARLRRDASCRTLPPEGDRRHARPSTPGRINMTHRLAAIGGLLCAGALVLAASAIAQ